MRSRALDRDRLGMFPRDEAVRLAHEALFPINKGDPEAMVAGIGVLFAAVCSRVGLDPQEVHQQSMRRLRDQQHHDKSNKSLQSLRDFAGLRIAGQDVVKS